MREPSGACGLGWPNAGGVSQRTQRLTFAQNGEGTSDRPTAARSAAMQNVGVGPPDRPTPPGGPALTLNRPTFQPTLHRHSAHFWVSAASATSPGVAPCLTP
jgi:hypothetical protein